MRGMSRLLGPSEAARILELSVDEIRRLARQGVLPAVLVGRWRAFRVEDVLRLKRQRERKARSAARGGTPHGERA